jgi:AcrR family transcriptional regulator
VSHQVVKSVRGRRYRYEVQSYRDPESGKVRGRWRYLGRVDADGDEVVPRPRRPAGTRERLLDALAMLLDSQEFSDVTVSNIAARAGLAHGTFYRYFSDKNAALRAAAGRIREEAERSRPDFAAPLRPLAAERARIRGWVETMLRAPVDRPGLLREWYAALARDPALQAERASRREESLRMFASYLRRLNAAGKIALERPAELAEALLTAIDGAFRGLALTRKPFGEATIAGVADLFDRAIFGPPAKRRKGS